MTRPGLRLALVVVPAVLLGVGWLLATLREAHLEEEKAAQLLEQQAGVVRAAVDESLEELRGREDARPFYLYNHFYSPPDVLALVDPVARSPLADPPADARVLGYLQIDPGHIVRTPYTPTGAAHGNQLAARVLAGLDQRSIAHLSARAQGSAVDVQLAQVTDEAPSGDASHGAKAQKARKKNPEEPVSLESDVGNAYTVSLNTWSNKLAQEIQEYQSDGLAADNVFRQQRVAPKTKRLDAQEQAQAARPPDDHHGPTPQQRMTASVDEVVYTPMRYERMGDELFLTRTVSHGGVTSVQAVRLDRSHLEKTWLPQVVERHTLADVRPRVISVDEACAHPLPVGQVLGGVALCFEPRAASAGLTGPSIQGGLLVALLAVVVWAAAAISRAEGRARALAEQQSAFVAAVSHELRTPLTTIRMNAEMLAEGLVSEAKQKVFLERQAHESVRLSHLVENVLEVSRLDAGRRVLERTEQDLGEHVAGVVEQQRTFLAFRGAEVAVSVPSAPLVVRFDRQAVEQIVVNLLDNAAKYGRTPGTDAAHIDVVVREGAGGAVIEVADHGPGVPAQDRERVFERFFRARRDDDQHVVGTGLGLSLVRDLARAHGGEVRVRSRGEGDAETAGSREGPGSGCLVEVLIPRG